MVKDFSTNVISAKAKALYGKRLTNADYEQLINKYSVSEVVAYLKSDTYYKTILESINESSIHRGQLELLIKTAEFERYMRFLSYDFVRRNDFFKYFILKSELEEILKVIRLLNSGSMDKYILTMPVFLIDYCDINLRDLTTVKNFKDLIQTLKGTHYYRALSKFEPENESNQIDVLGCETELRKTFYNRIFKKIDSEFSSSVAKEIKKIFLIQIDMINISIIYRLKKFFFSNNLQIKSCLLPFSYYLKESIVDEMIASDSLEQLVLMIKKTQYGKYFDIEEMEYIEDFANKYIYKLVRKNMYFLTHPSIVMICYILLSEIEVKNIITIIEGVSYKMSPEEIRKSLITNR
jgi:V/A-type H+-transporting ATPase subunit C